MREIREQLRENYGPHIALNSVIYSGIIDRNKNEFRGTLNE